MTVGKVLGIGVQCWVYLGRGCGDTVGTSVCVGTTVCVGTSVCVS